MKIFLLILISAFMLLVVLSKWKTWSIKKVEYKRYFEKDRVFVDEQVKITTEISNRKLLSLPWIEVQAEIPKEFNFKDQKVYSINDKSNKIYRVVTSLISYQKVKRSNIIYCTKRGYYYAYDVKITIGDYFGLQTAEKSVEYPIILIVYPKIKPLEKLIVPYKNPQGDVSVKRWVLPDPLDIIGAREYTSNDSFNTIDWKATAKLGSLHVKKFDYTADPSIVTILNVQTSPVHWQDVKTSAIEKGIDIIASITDKALEAKIPIGYTSNAFFNGDVPEIYIPPKYNNNQKTAILEALAKTSYSRRTSVEELLRFKQKLMQSGSIIIILTTFISTELINEMRYLKKLGHTFKIILLDKNQNIDTIRKEFEILTASDMRQV